MFFGGERRVCKICVCCLHDLCTVEKLLADGGQIIILRVRGAWGEHRVQYRFSILGWGGSSFISILSVSGYMEVGRRADVRRAERVLERIWESFARIWWNLRDNVGEECGGG